MKGNVSGYVCNHGSPSGERDTASPRLWAMLRTQASDEEADDVCSRWSFYYGSTGSDVMGCRRPTGGVFTYVSSDRVTLRAFPVATPRGRSVSFPTRGTMVTYVTWDVFLLLVLFTAGTKTSVCNLTKFKYRSLDVSLSCCLSLVLLKDTLSAVINARVCWALVHRPHAPMELRAASVQHYMLVSLIWWTEM